MAGAPGKLEFLRNGMNIIDVLAVLPYYVEQGMAIMESEEITRGESGLSGTMDNVTYRSDPQEDQYHTQTLAGRVHAMIKFNEPML